MKILTKPEKFRIASPSIYGYGEGEWMETIDESDCGITYTYDCVGSDAFDCDPDVDESYSIFIPNNND